MRRWRLSNDFAVRDIADSIGIAASTLVHIEQGKTPPHSDTLIKLMTWLLSEETDASNGNKRTDEAVPEKE